jgi:phosphatidylinositol glycan class N
LFLIILVKYEDNDFRAYLDNILLVDAGIKEVVEVIEKFYNNDGHTAYIMSSDHGMTDWGNTHC